MIEKVFQSKLSQLESRVQKLEERTTWTPPSKKRVGSLLLDQQLEKIQLHERKHALAVQNKTFGMIDGKRVKQWLQRVEQGRRAWK